MTDLFISYARGDRPIADRLAKAFEKLHWTVWWDRELVVGEIFDKHIKEALKKARCVIVLWSSNSVSSDWVKKEALFGAKHGKLIPVLLEDVEIPKRLRRIHAARMIGWKGSSDDSKFKDLVKILQSRFGRRGFAYYVLLETVPRLRNREGGVFSGEHLKNCLDKASSERRRCFLDSTGIVESEKGKYVIGVREFPDGHKEYGAVVDDFKPVKLWG